MKKINYNEKGITLVALVITIIILLILTGVTLNNALSDNGLFRRAKEAAKKYKESEEQEQELLDDIGKEIDSIIPAKAGTPLPIPEGKDWDENKVEAVASGEGNIIPVPKNFYYAGGSETTGFVISDVENDDLNNSKNGNQFVWIPCTESQYNEAKGDVIDEQWSCNPSYKVGGSKTAEGTGNGKEWRDNYTEEDTKKLDEVYTGTNKLPTSEWQSKNQITIGKESIKKYGGFYIARYEAGVPEDASFHVSTSEDVMKYVNTEGKAFNDIVYSDSTTEHGRGSVADTSIIKDLKPLSKKGVQAWNYITQPNSKLVAENMYKESGSVGSYLVDSQAWNYICKNIFHANKGEKANDSTSWGNYYDNKTTKYQELDCLWAKHINNSEVYTIATEYKKEGIKDTDYPKGSGNVRLELSTGASNDFKKYNIYDMAGNIWEWTTGHNVVTTNVDTKQMFVEQRGGSFGHYGADYPVVRANGNNEFTHYNYHIGFRVVLYVK